jgi:menaquinone-dependent protoporphyrinogen oxidase
MASDSPVPIDVVSPPRVTASIKRVLVAFGSRRGGTAEIAAAVAETLRAQGLIVDCMRAAEVREVARYDAFVVGGALYATRWIREARRFVVRNAPALRARPVWMFSSGPLDDSANRHAIAPVRGVAALMAHVAARGHTTFGGRLAADATGFPAAAMARTHAGDWRSWDQIEGWAREIASTLATLPHPEAPSPRPARGLLATACLGTGLPAIAGGIALVARPDGTLLHIPTSALSHSPFSTFLVPGLLLLFVIGVANVIAGWLVIRDRPNANAWAIAAGGTLLGWMVLEMVMLRSIHVLQLVFFAVSVVSIIEALRRRLDERVDAASRVVQTWP